MAKKARKPVSAATRAKLSAAGKRRWRKMSPTAKSAAIRRLKGGSTSAPARSSGRRKSTAKRAKSTAKRAKSTAKSAIQSARKKAKGGFSGFVRSLTPKKTAATLIMLGGVAESVNNAGRDWGGDAATKVQQVLAPVADAAMTAKIITKAASSSATAPGLVGELANWRFSGGNAPVITPRRLVNAAPSLTGWYLGIQRYLEIRKVANSVVHENVFPRLSSIANIRVRNAHAIGGQWVRTFGGSGNMRDMGVAVLDSPITPVLVGGAASKIVAKTQVM